MGIYRIIDLNVKLDGCERTMKNAEPYLIKDYDGDYDFEVAVADGRIVGADYEVDEEWLDTLGGSPVDQEGVRQLVAAKVPGASAQDVQVWEEGAATAAAAMRASCTTIA